jgi:hypothetical protein
MFLYKHVRTILIERDSRKKQPDTCINTQKKICSSFHIKINLLIHRTPVEELELWQPETHKTHRPHTLSPCACSHQNEHTRLGKLLSRVNDNHMQTHTCKPRHMQTMIPCDASWRLRQLVAREAQFGQIAETRDGKEGPLALNLVMC